MIFGSNIRVLLPVLTSFLVAGSFIAGKYTTVELRPLTTSLLRYGIAMAVLGLLIARSTHPTQSLTVARADWGAMALLGLFGVVGYLTAHFCGWLSLAVFSRTVDGADGR